MSQQPSPQVTGAIRPPRGTHPWPTERRRGWPATGAHQPCLRSRSSVWTSSTVRRGGTVDVAIFAAKLAARRVEAARTLPSRRTKNSEATCTCSCRKHRRPDHPAVWVGELPSQKLRTVKNWIPLASSRALRRSLAKSSYTGPYTPMWEPLNHPRGRNMRIPWQVVQ